MNTKITIAATALTALLFAAGAFAQAVNEYPAGQPVDGLWNQTLPPNGNEGAVQSPNGLPPGAVVGTEQYTDQQVLNAYEASQIQRQVAAQLRQSHG